MSCVVLVPPAVLPPGAPYVAAVERALSGHRTAMDAALSRLGARASVVAEIAALLVRTLQTGHKVLAAGKGGSAAEAQHFAAELVGHFRCEHVPYAALSLATDTAILTAVANDYGYSEVFARQVLGLGQPGDLLVAFSTSGDSENLVRAAAAARQRRMTAIALTANRESRLSRVAGVTLRVPVVDTATAQELHMAVTHTLCDIVEAELIAPQGDAH
jgi:D-sedoheptulose 7-phosphate isomerase